MARASRPTGDKATNARRRYYRSAERYLKQAQNAVGAYAAKARALAQIQLENALKTYSKNTTQSFAKPIQRIANALGVDLNQKRQEMKQRTDVQEKSIREHAIDVERSKRSLASANTPEALRQREARALLNSPIGSRIIGGTVKLWEEEAQIKTDDGTKIDNKKILPILYERFEVDNLADLLDKMQDIAGSDLYASADDNAFYESAKITIQTYIAENGIITQ